MASTDNSKVPTRCAGETRETLIGMLANRQFRAVDRLHSRLAGNLPYYDVRFQAFAPPVGDWALCLRCHAMAVRPLDAMTGMVDGLPHYGVSPAAGLASSGFGFAIKAAIARGATSGMSGAGDCLSPAGSEGSFSCPWLEEQRPLPTEAPH